MPPDDCHEIEYVGELGWVKLRAGDVTARLLAGLPAPCIGEGGWVRRMVGELAVLDGQPRVADVVAEEPTRSGTHQR